MSDAEILNVSKKYVFSFSAVKELHDALSSDNQNEKDLDDLLNNLSKNHIGVGFILEQRNNFTRHFRPGWNDKIKFK